MSWGYLGYIRTIWDCPEVAPEPPEGVLRFPQNYLRKAWGDFNDARGFALVMWWCRDRPTVLDKWWISTYDLAQWESCLFRLQPWWRPASCFMRMQSTHKATCRNAPPHSCWDKTVLVDVTFLTGSTRGAYAKCPVLLIYLAQAGLQKILKCLYIFHLSNFFFCYSIIVVFMIRFLSCSCWVIFILLTAFLWLFMLSLNSFFSFSAP